MTVLRLLTFKALRAGICSSLLLGLLPCVLVVGLVARDAMADSRRYFAVWSYTENAPSEEIGAEGIAERKLGYWALDFSSEGEVLGGTYHGSDGAVWLSLRYVEAQGKIYADLYGPRGNLIARKSTQLTNLKPRIHP
jgi:hypothetical protein